MKKLNLKTTSLNSSKRSFRRVVLVLGIVIGTFTLNAQENLILNPSGEEASFIPSSTGYFPVNDWWLINQNITPDYFSSLNNSTCLNHIPQNIYGFQHAHGGNFYFGIVNLDWGLSLDPINGSCWMCRVEYLAGQFTRPLEKGKTYLFEFWVSKADSLNLISNALDLFIAYNTEVDVHDFDNYANYGYVIWSEDEPFAEKKEWVKISACFQAKGGERAFAIGNFHELSKIEVIYPFPVHVTVDYRYLDDFSLIECPTCCPEQFPVEDQVTVFANPSVTGEPTVIEMWLVPNSTGKLRIYDSAGRLVADEHYSDLQNLFTFKNVANGLYHYHFTTDLGYAETGKVLVNE
jgi:hypothetical protein